MQNLKSARASRGKISFIILHSSFCILFAACSTSGPGSHAGENYVVNSQRTSFFKYGPAQASGPDFALTKGQRLTMLSRQFGYSHVAMDSGQSGYVATEDLAPAPPESNPSPSPTPAPNLNTSAERPERRERAPTREEEAQVPLPDLPQGRSSPAPGIGH